MNGTVAMEDRRRSALAAWDTGRRRRSIGSLLDRAADASLATGGLFLANAAAPLGFGIPGGRAGTSIGASLLGAGIAWLVRTRRRPVTPPRVTTGYRAAPVPAYAVPPARAALRRVA